MSVEYKPPKKVNVMLPVFGLVLAIALAILAFVLSEPIVRSVPQLRDIKAGVRVGGELISWGRLLVAGGMWTVMMTFSYLLVAVLAGRDPKDTSKMKLPPRKVQPKKKDY
jgi:hypothetical protein